MMNDIFTILRQMFLPRAGSILSGIIYGICLVAICWYPLPDIMRNMNYPSWAYPLSVIIILFILCLVGWKLIKNPSMRVSGMEGWAIIAYIISGCALAISVSSKFLQIIVSGVVVLPIYIAVILIYQKFST